MAGGGGGGDSAKWMVLVASTWIQAFTGTNFDFSTYSSDLKSVLSISQLQLNYLTVASDLGKAFGWCAGLSLLYLPLWIVMFIAAFMSLFGYGVQWLVIQKLIYLPYFLVFLLCLVAGCSISWFNTVAYVLCIRNFQENRALAQSLSISFNGISAAIYTLIANAINPLDDTLYPLLNALVPLITSLAVLFPILRKSTLQLPTTDTLHQDSVIFFFLYAIAVFTGLYLLLLNSISSYALAARILFGGAILLLIFPVCIPGIITRRSNYSSLLLNGSSFVDNNSSDLSKELIERESMRDDTNTNGNGVIDIFSHSSSEKEGWWCCGNLTVLGEETPAQLLVRRWDFWLYYMAYFCGGTIGLVYSNNLGQISESLGYGDYTDSIVTLYSSCSFFGRLLAATPDIMGNKWYLARTGWFASALIPTPIAFLLLASSGSWTALSAGTGLIGLSSGFIFAAAVSITSELFGANSFGLNHNILITNIPIGSFLYGLLAALVYDSNASVLSFDTKPSVLSDTMVCMGRQCYFQTFVWWGCISTLGVASSFLLFSRTRRAYRQFERSQS